MTRIEKLEIQGFKSFAKKTVLTFPSNFSVICGPNGSGKSNVLDALCFVLGRTSAKSLRADKMLETVFHGTKKKPAAEFAKVSIWFDNSNKEFPFEDEKVVISRKINDKGVSIYRLNGKTETRETIQEIFRPAQIKPDGHNIILQGDITEIIEMNPIERREIIDDISGIREFDDKRNKAQKELMTVEDRLKESHILLNEKSSNIERLEAEKKSAQEYQTMTVELDKLRASLAKIRLEQAEEAMGKLDGKIVQISTGNYEKEVNDLDIQLEALEKKRNDLSKKLFDRTKDIAIIKEAERMRSEISRKRDRIDMGRSEIERTNDMIKRLDEMKQKDAETSGGRVIQEITKLGWTGIYGTVASLCNVPSEHQTAIEVAAGPHLYDIVVSDQSVAIECVNYLKKNKLGRATFLPLDKIRPRSGDHLGKMLKQPGVVGVAIDLIDFNAKYFNAFSFVLGDTLVCDRIETTRKLGIGEARYVTLDGDLVERSGAIIGGFYIRKRAFADNTAEDVKSYVLRREQVEKEMGQLEKEIIILNESLQRVSTQEQMGSKEVVDMQNERDEVEKNYEEMRRRRKAIFDEKINSQEEINKLRISKARLEAELDNLQLEFQNYTKTETYDLPVATLEVKIRDTTQKVNMLGAINMKALDEYNEQKVVFDELKDKVDKLLEERNKIIEIIADVEGRRKEVFTKTLEGVRDQFKKVFNDLMRSEADLRLVGGLDSGLIIEASTKGNKMTNIDAMSGGEKTLTAMAFLFAIQRFKPAPFYILDEIDAALDKPNTKKIVELIKKYTSHSQFIVITHNEATIQEAGCVYGVTMEEGESNLIGIRMPG